MFVFLVMLAIMIAAMYSTVLVTYASTVLLMEYKSAHPEYNPPHRSGREMIGVIAICVVILGFPVLNVSFANFCVNHYEELKSAVFAQLETQTV